MITNDPAQARPVASRRVLVVDDNPEFTQVLKDHLVRKRDPSWIVHTAKNYSEGLDCLKANPVDLVILDIQMPVMDGLQLLTLLKRRHPALPVIVLSAMVTPENRDYALKHGAALILEKMELASGFDSLYPALEATAEAPAEGFKGMLRQVGLIELLQLECLGRKSSIMELKGSNANGRIYISEGSIIHAEFDTLLGEKALARLLRLTGGEFRLAPFTQPSRHTINGQWEGILMEAAQASDEQDGEAAALEAGGAVATTDAGSAEAGTQGEETERRVEEIVFCSTGNDIVYQWKAPQAERRVRLFNFLLTKSVTVGKMLPVLGRAQRFEINEPQSRVICLLQPERKIFVRLSILPRTA